MGPQVVSCRYLNCYWLCTQAALARVTRLAQFGLLALVLVGERAFAAVGVPVPAWYQQTQQQKLPVLMAIWFIGNMMQNSLSSSGAFEVFYDGQLVSVCPCGYL